MTRKIETKSTQEKEIEKLDEQFKEFDATVRSMTLDHMNSAPLQDYEPSARISQKELEKNNELYLKPTKSIGSKEKFNESYRKEYEYAKEFVNFIAEHREIVGETIEMWTKPFAGMPAEFWNIPVNKPVWAPRYVAEQIKRKRYHRLESSDGITQGSAVGNFYGGLIVDKTIQRLDAHPVNSSRSVFMGSAR